MIRGALLAIASLSSAIGVAAMATGCDSCAKNRSAAGDAAADASAATSADAAPVNVTVLPTASVAKLVNPEGLPSYTGPTGSVEGTITVVGDPAPATPANFSRCPDAEKTWGHSFREGPPKGGPDGPRALADAVVAVTGYSGFYIPEKADVEELTIEGCAFTKRTVTMTFGQALDVRNLSKDFWTPLLSSSGRAVMRMASPKGDPVRLYPKEPGHYLVTDHDRTYAFADLYVFLHSLHTSSKLDGSYRIDGLPVGKVKVNTSHPRFPGEASTELNVQAGVVHRVDLQLKYKKPETPALPPDAGPLPKLR